MTSDERQVKSELDDQAAPQDAISIFTARFARDAEGAEIKIYSIVVERTTMEKGTIGLGDIGWAIEVI